MPTSNKLRKQKRSPKIPIILALIGIFLVLAFWLYNRSQQNSSEQAGDSNPVEESINYNPPTEEEQSAGDQQKDVIMTPNDTGNTGSDSSKKQVSVVITDAGQYGNDIEVRAFIPNHFEDGTCTITFTKDAQKVSKQTPAYRDATTTICTNPEFTRSEFPSAGDWQVVVVYSSSSANGTSASLNVTIN